MKISTLKVISSVYIPS